ncbi:NAD(P)/FAD-dependent oxidoreductase [Paracoccus fontiphilus]|uniref:NAD(P)/FAD-dependent oxidoreductase n=1 Tax=Paracoccus fontiphilus TaxID=1815556 RepID=A0ABV7ILQ4_9RHOB|nr:FAD-dependent oxidoreductase [Paracoccus fontiphilus]
MSRDDNVTAIIGGGIIGICCALYLQEKGFRVEIIDRAGGDDQRASYGNAGNLSPWSCVPESIPGLWKSVPGWLIDPLGPMAVKAAHLPVAVPWLLRFLAAGRIGRVERQADALRSLYAPVVDLYEDLLRPTGQLDLIRRCVYVTLYRDEAQADLGALGWRLRRDRGAKLRKIGAGELREIEPDLSHDYQAAILIHGQGRTTEPQRLLSLLTERVLRQGGVLHRADTRGIRPDPDGVDLYCSDGTRRFRRAVIAAGAWSAQLLRTMGLHVPLETERGYHLTIRDPGVTINNTLMEAGRMVVASTMEGGLRLAGTVELAGLKPAPDYRRAKNLATLGREMFPALRVGEAGEWMGHRPSLPDSLPVIGRAPGHRNVLLAFGHSHLGLSGGAPTGRLIAQLAAGRPTSIDLTPFRLDRF